MVRFDIFGRKKRCGKRRRGAGPGWPGLLGLMALVFLMGLPADVGRLWTDISVWADAPSVGPGECVPCPDCPPCPLRTPKPPRVRPGQPSGGGAQCITIDEKTAGQLKAEEKKRQVAGMRKAIEDAEDAEGDGDWEDAIGYWTQAIELCRPEGNCEDLSRRLRNAQAQMHRLLQLSDARDDAKRLENVGKWDLAASAWGRAYRNCRPPMDCTEYERRHAIASFRAARRSFDEHMATNSLDFAQFALREMVEACRRKWRGEFDCERIQANVVELEGRLDVKAGEAQARLYEQQGSLKQAMDAWAAALKSCRGTSECKRIKGEYARVRLQYHSRTGRHFANRGAWAEAESAYAKAVAQCGKGHGTRDECAAADKGLGVARAEGRFEETAADPRRHGATAEQTQHRIEPAFRQYARAYRALVDRGHFTDCEAMAELANGLATRSDLSGREQAEVLVSVLASTANPLVDAAQHELVPFRGTGFKSNLVGPRPDRENQVRHFIAYYNSIHHYVGALTELRSLRDDLLLARLRGQFHLEEKWDLDLAIVAGKLARRMIFGFLRPDRLGFEIKRKICQ